MTKTAREPVVEIQTLQVRLVGIILVLFVYGGVCTCRHTYVSVSVCHYSTFFTAYSAWLFLICRKSVPHVN